MAKNKAAQELGRKGGPATFKKHGKAHYKRMAEESWKHRPSKKVPPVDPSEIM